MCREGDANGCSGCNGSRAAAGGAQAELGAEADTIAPRGLLDECLSIAPATAAGDRDRAPPADHGPLVADSTPVDALFERYAYCCCFGESAGVRKEPADVEPPGVWLPSGARSEPLSAALGATGDMGTRGPGGACNEPAPGIGACIEQEAFIELGFPPGPIASAGTHTALDCLEADLGIICERTGDDDGMRIDTAWSVDAGKPAMLAQKHEPSGNSSVPDPKPGQIWASALASRCKLGGVENVRERGPCVLIAEGARRVSICSMANSCGSCGFGSCGSHSCSEA